MTNEEIRVKVQEQLAQYPEQQQAFRLMKLAAQYPDVDLIELLSGDSDD